MEITEEQKLIIEETISLHTREACVLHAFFAHSIPMHNVYTIPKDVLWKVLINANDAPAGLEAVELSADEIALLKKTTEDTLYNEIAKLPGWSITDYLTNSYHVSRHHTGLETKPVATIKGMDLQQLREYLDDEENDEEACKQIAEIICSLVFNSPVIDYTSLSALDSIEHWPVVSDLLYYVNWGDGYTNSFEELADWCQKRFNI